MASGANRDSGAIVTLRRIMPVSLQKAALKTFRDGLFEREF
jgi:hypothetical protein